MCVPSHAVVYQLSARSFDPVVNEVLDLISRQLDMSPSIDALLLVGGFSGSAYLKTRVEVSCDSNCSRIVFAPAIHVLLWLNIQLETLC